MSFYCESCGKDFDLPEKVLAKYPGWKPRTCLACRDTTKAKKPGAPKKRSATSPQGRANAREEGLDKAEVLLRYTAGPHDGLFTDGACSGNPGPGGCAEMNGYDPDTTNNRMEMLALIRSYELLPTDAHEVIYSDSQLCVKTINEWAAGWERRGWKRKQGPVKNLELVKQAHALAKAHPHVELCWIKAHNGSRWNEYADALATAYMREKV
ncbi:MAG: ribonuclease HI [Deltaproteobacteria bacterium]|nr:ribonuclease HI [Deltaproteobacteria bacterium]